VEVLRVLTTDGWKSASGTALLHIDNPHLHAERPLAVGQRVVAFGMLQQPNPAMNPGEFDWAEYYRDQRVLASLHVAHAENVRILDDPGPSPLDRVRLAARDLLAKGFGPERSLDHALLRALVLGDKDPELRDVQEDFVRTGTSHHLAISGAHVMILGMFVFGACRLILLSPRLSVWIGLASVILYGLVALPSPPVVRSVLLCVVVGFGLLAGRSIDGVQLLAVSVFAMLVCQPLDLFNAGFQLSFGTVLGLMTLTNPAIEFLASLEDPDVKVARAARPPTGWRAGLLRARSWTVKVLVAGVVAWVVSAPLIAVLFRQLNPWAIPGSLILAPVVAVSLMLGLLKILLTLAMPFFAGALATVAAAPVALMRWTVDWLASLPGSELPILMTVPLAMFLYALLFLPLFVRVTRLRWCVRCSPAAAVLVLFVLPPLGGWAPRDPAANDLRVTLLSVGAGQCAAVHLPSGEVVLIDAGSSTIADLHGRIIDRYLRHHGRRGVDSVFVSHANYDHYSAVESLLSDAAAREIFLTPHFLRHAGDSNAARSVLESARRRRATVRQLATGDSIELDAETSLRVLWPPPEATLKPNDASLVLRLTCRGRRVLFTGDVQEEAQRALLSKPDELRADVLVAPHHGSTEATTAAFLETVNAAYVLSSNDRTLSQKQRRLEALCGSRALLRTHAHGAITVTVEPDGDLDVTTFRRPN
jgi:competence protein ComEC